MPSPQSLQQKCLNQTPPIPMETTGADGKTKTKTLNPLIEELKKAGLYNEAGAKQLRAWADIRNLVDHGHFDQVSQHDVDLMLKGIGNFLAEYLG